MRMPIQTRPWLRRPEVLTLAFIFWLAASGLATPGFSADIITLPAQTVGPGQVKVMVNVALPAGHKLNQEAPSSLILSSQDQGVLQVQEKLSGTLTAAKLPVTLTVPAKAGKTTLQAEFKLNFCDDKVGLCFLREATVQLPVEVVPGAKGQELKLLYEVKNP